MTISIDLDTKSFNRLIIDSFGTTTRRYEESMFSEYLLTKVATIDLKDPANAAVALILYGLLDNKTRAELPERTALWLALKKNVTADASQVNKYCSYLAKKEPAFYLYASDENTKPHDRFFDELSDALDSGALDTPTLLEMWTKFNLVTFQVHKLPHWRIAYKFICNRNFGQKEFTEFLSRPRTLKFVFEDAIRVADNGLSLDPNLNQVANCIYDEALNSSLSSEPIRTLYTQRSLDIWLNKIRGVSGGFLFNLIRSFAPAFQTLSTILSLNSSDLNDAIICTPGCPEALSECLRTKDTMYPHANSKGDQGLGSDDHQSAEDIVRFCGEDTKESFSNLWKK